MKLQPFKSSRLGWRVLAAFYTSFLLIILLLAYTSNLPPQLERIPFYDKIGHLVLYGIAAYLGHRVLGYRRVRLGILVIPLFPFLFAIVTVAEETLQILSPNRTFDVTDLIASFLGITLGYYLAERR